jgi:dTDP-glucose 4,6-dehydratase
MPITVYRGHKRIFDFVDDTCRTFANIVENFIPGRVYNVGGREEWAISIEELAQIILQETGADRGLAQFRSAEDFTTRVKVVDFSRARQELHHDPKIDIREGVRRYVAWMRTVYQTSIANS